MRVLSISIMATWVVERLKSKWRNEDSLNIYNNIKDRASKVNEIVNISSKRNIEINIYRNKTINSSYSKKMKK